MQYDREDLRIKFREKYGPDTTFPACTNGLRYGDTVEFDVTERKVASRLERQARQGIAVDVFEHSSEDGSRAMEVVVIVPAIVETTGRVVTPVRMYVRPRHAVRVLHRHGGPGHEAAACRL